MIQSKLMWLRQQLAIGENWNDMVRARRGQQVTADGHAPEFDPQRSAADNLQTSLMIDDDGLPINISMIGPSNLKRAQHKIQFNKKIARTCQIRPRSATKQFTSSAMRHAWLAVKRAKGGAGMDGMTLRKFEADLDSELETLRGELIQGSYRPRPIRQVLVPKAGKGMRSLAIWALRDRIAQRVLYDLIAPAFEPLFLPCSFGFRPSLSTGHAIRQVEAYRDINLRWIVDADIKNCFDEIDSKRLMGLIRQQIKDRQLLGYIHRWLNADLMNSMDGKPRKAGTSQGSVLSPLLANIYLHELDKALVKQNLAVVRYADDLLICCQRKNDALAAQTFLARSLRQMSLQLNEQKTRVLHLDEGVQWLGYFLIRKERFQL